MRKKIFYLNLAALAAFAFAVLFSGILFFLPLPGVVMQSWKGYYTVAVLENTNIKSLHANLTGQGFNSIIDESTVRVDFNDFPVIASVPLKEIGNRLEEQDPRYDKYLKFLPRYFHTEVTGKRYYLLYIRQNGHPLFSLVHLIKGLSRGGRGWILLNINIWLKILFLFLFILVVGLSFILYGKKRFYLFAVLLPWLMLVIYGGFLEFAVSSITAACFLSFFDSAVPVFAFYLNHGYSDNKFSGSVYKMILYLISVLISLSFLLVTKVPGWNVLRFAGIIFGSLFFLAGYAFSYSARSLRQEHRIFFRVPLWMSSVGARRNHRQSIILLIILGIQILAPAVAGLPRTARKMEVPVPVKINTGKLFTWESFASFKMDKRSWTGSATGNSLLPDIADYITHRAFQDSFLYGRDYLFPEKGEKVGISTFTQQDGKIKKNQKEKLVFSDNWFHTILSPEYGGNILNLWLTEKGPVAVKLGGVDYFQLSVKSLFIYWILCLINFSPLGFTDNHLTAKGMYGIKGLMLRRKRQTA